MNKKIGGYGVKMICYLARKVAEREANTTCPIWGYQPKLPDSVKRLKKYY